MAEGYELPLGDLHTENKQYALSGKKVSEAFEHFRSLQDGSKEKTDEGEGKVSGAQILRKLRFF